MKLIIKKGATSVIIAIFIQNSSSTTGAGLTGLTSGSSGFTCYRARSDDGNAGGTSITLSGGTRGTFSSGGFVEKDATNMPGLYEFGVPNAAIAAGSNYSIIMFKGATNQAPLVLEIQLVDYDPNDTVRLGLTALPNVASGSAGAIPTTGTGSNQISVSSGQVILQAGTGPGQLDFTSGVVKANLAQILATALTETAGQLAAGFKQWFNVATPTGTVNSIPNAVAGATGGLFIAGTNAATTITTALTTTFTGNLTGSVASVTGAVGSVTGAVGSVTGAVGSVTGNVGGNVTGSVGSVATGGITRASFAADTGEQTIRSNTAQAGAATTITLDASASASNSFYNNCIVYLTGGTGVGQARFITAYVGATKVATVATWVTNPDNTTTFAILPFDAVAGATAPTAAQIATAVWQDSTSGDFTAASSIGKSLYTAGVVPGASGGVFIAGSNAATTVNVTGNLTGNVTGSVGSVASGGITRASLAADTGLQPVRSNTAAAGSGTTITLDAGASSVNSFYNNDIVYITGGTGAGQARFITAYVGGTQVATVATWVTNPDNTSTFAILPFDAVAGATAPTAAQIATAVWQDTTAGDFTTSGSIGKSLFTSGAVPGAAGGLFIAGSNAATTVNITGNITGNLSGSVGSVTGAVGSVTGNIGGNLLGTLTTTERTAIADAMLDETNGVETGLTVRQAYRLVASTTGAKLSGAGTGTEVYRNAVADSANRVTATVDASGNRSAITYNL